MADKEKNTRSAASKERYFQAGVALVTVLLFFGILIGLGCVTTFSEKERTKRWLLSRNSAAKGSSTAASQADWKHMSPTILHGTMNG